MYLRNAWYVAATSDELPTGRLVARTILEEPIVLFRDRDARIAALEDRCCHRAAPLSLGELSDKGIACGYHGLVFNAEGRCVEIPGQAHIPERARVKAYPVMERGGFVWVWTGDSRPTPETAIPQIPAYTTADDERPRYAHGVMHVKAGYELFLENLMDLTHLAYLHKNTIGSRAQDHTGATMETVQTERGVRYTRLMLDAVPPAEYAARYRFTGRVDRWEEFEYIAPSSVVQFTGAVAAGQYAKGVRLGGHNLRALLTYTPETEHTCFHFYSFISAHDSGNRPPSTSAPEVLAVLAEDVRMIEQQQLRLEGYDMNRLTAIPSDTARIAMTRFLSRKIAEEQAARNNA